MIYTVTFNPSLDYIVNVKQLKLGTVNRTERELLFPVHRLWSFLHNFIVDIVDIVDNHRLFSPSCAENVDFTG